MGVYGRLRLDAAVKEAARIVREGGIVVYPTDTVYGLGCDPFNTSSVKKLLEVKKRGMKSLPILVSSIKQAMAIALFNRTASLLAKTFWPGPLTLVLPSSEAVPPIVTGETGNVGVRKPNSILALRLIRLSGGALIGTSANLSGGKPAVTAEEASRMLGDKVDYILDGGKNPGGVSSTVIQIRGTTFTILRGGPISRHVIQNVLQRHRF